ncbi:MAG: aminomethyl-transferring glycine dehydrogenase [Gammaproteobacteria bacterium]|nr:aminomethyl-transferring glycine dehydrogenase [Gammaproteobacteria bacterium]
MASQREKLSALEADNEFMMRHVGPGPAEQREMLKALDLSSLDELIERVVPADIRGNQPLAVPEAAGEAEVLRLLRAIAGKNRVFRSFIGMGYYDTHTPTVIQRNILENPAWYTAYTPYQSEISQGRLEALLNFQTIVVDLTGMEIANASMLDESSAAAEAMTLSKRVSRNKGNVYFVARDCHPQTIDVVRTRARPLDIEVVVGDPLTDAVPDDVFGALLQYPGTRGDVADYRAFIKSVQGKRGLVTMAADILALALITPPGELGADIAVGNTQRFGVPMGYGGPHAAYMATKDAYKRSLPGRLVGVSRDTRGNRSYRLALATREQHIRREKATSNICTAQSLLAIMAAMYATYHGPDGLRRIARRVHRLTGILAGGLRALGVEVETNAYFDTITVTAGDAAGKIASRARDYGVNLRENGDGTLGVALNETTNREDVQLLWRIFGGTEDIPTIDDQDEQVAEVIPAPLRRKTPYLEDPVFHEHHTETGLLRYMRRLADMDLALDRSMIPLGSCTMKLNATTEMVPVTWPEFAGIHPFAPLDQALGYRELCDDIEAWLCACTGYAAVSLQPNAGSQGEYAGLLAIKAYHESRGEGHRSICLIPSSAHGTNPASAAMAGMKVVVVESDADGNIDIEDLRGKAEEHASELAAIMITYPSTHGVFEAKVREVCDIIHRHGGQVYIDGANLNAMVGVCEPGNFGGDVSHLNLHKTFAIPHGGGGPGVGPIGVREHLKPFLPGHFMLEEENCVGPVASAPWGSAGILPITWAYLRLLGREGLRYATCNAILNANYVARRLEPHYPVLYTGPGGMVAHECILDLRPIKEQTGITVEDVSKRLMDYGFHAPTMSFPVSGTLMVEPTESESRAELDRFIHAMIEIRGEIRDVEKGRLDPEDNPLRNAPHTAVDVSRPWEHAYTPEQALRLDCQGTGSKYWPPVNRIDNIYGDRNVVCTCPPVSAYRDGDPGKNEAA